MTSFILNFIGTSPTMNKKASFKLFRSITQITIQRNLNTAKKSFKFPKFSVKYVTKTSQYLILEENDKKSYEYPLIWLRDNCQCSKCFHKTSSSRTINWEKFSLNQNVKNLVHDQENRTINIEWDDDHKSEFDENWLIERNFSEENRVNYLNNSYRPLKAPLWGKTDFDRILKTFAYEKVIGTDQGLFDWLDALSRNGIAIIRGTPLNRNECRRLADRVGFIRKTHYGEEFEVIAKEGTSNVAYLSSTLQLHTDLPYYEYKPGVNLLHCLVQSDSKGGHNQITDGFYVANLLKEEYPEYFKTLTSTLVNWSDIGEENGNKFHSIFRAPVIMLDYDQNFARINHSVPQRDSFFTVPLKNVNKWYEAMKMFVKLVHDETVVFKTQPGDILTFDNIRLIHGRTEYEDNTSNTRHIIGSYLDWDEIYSRLRVLRRSLKEK
uniref:CSON007050 protein n=1 Tax=Culicoides sonorensis TaxID=179676 RepID=A0A336MZN0_CULSO